MLGYGIPDPPLSLKRSQHFGILRGKSFLRNLAANSVPIEVPGRAKGEIVSFPCLPPGLPICKLG